MLNPTQKALINAYLENGLFSSLDDYREKDPTFAIKAYQATLSLHLYLQIKEELQQKEIESEVRSVGELLSHPAPQNPMFNASLANGSYRVSPIAVIANISGEYVITHKGVLNLSAKNNPEEKVTQAEVEGYIKECIQNKIAEIGEEVDYEKQVKSKENSDVFTQKSIKEQLDFLGISQEGAPVIDENKMDEFKLFLQQFGYSDELLDSLDSVKKHVSDWYAKSLEQFQNTCDYIGEHNCYRISFAEVVEAKTGKFSQFLEREIAPFYAYKALQRVALWNGHFGMISELEPDHSDIVFLLVKGNHAERLVNHLEKYEQEIHCYHANFILLQIINASPFELQIFLYLKNLAHSDCKIWILEQLMIKTIGPVFHLIILEFLRELKFQNVFSSDLFTKAFTKAIELDDFEMQALALLHAPEKCSARNLLSPKTFFTLVEGKFYQAAAKMAFREYAGSITAEHIRQANIMSQGEYRFSMDATVQKQLRGETLSQGAQYFTPAYRLNRTRAIVERQSNSLAPQEATRNSNVNSL